MGARLETYIVSTLRMSNERVVYDDNCYRKRIQLEGGRSRRGEGDKEGDNLAAFVVALCSSALTRTHKPGACKSCHMERLCLQNCRLIIHTLG